MKQFILLSAILVTTISFGQQYGLGDDKEKRAKYAESPFVLEKASILKNETNLKNSKYESETTKRLQSGAYVLDNEFDPKLDDNYMKLTAYYNLL